MTQPPICDYEGSPYQQVFWEDGRREYEDLCEAQALRRLLPARGTRLLELGAGAGRNTPRYHGVSQVILLDYSRTQLAQARERLGASDRYVYVAANIYQLPFVDALFDAATMIRVLHHMADAPAALLEIRRVLEPRAVFILEYANKRNLKSIARYLLRRQPWSPFSGEPVEFAAMNFNFHPAAVAGWLTAARFRIRRQVTVSHFRMGLIKRAIPARWLAAADSILGMTGGWLQFSPSVFVGAETVGGKEKGTGFFRCPACGGDQLVEETRSGTACLRCAGCGARWAIRGGIYDFKEPFTD